MRESTCGIELFPSSLSVLSRPLASLLSNRYDTRSVFTMVGRETRNITIAQGGNENKWKETLDGIDDDELSFDEDETSDGFPSSGDNASAGGQMMSEAVQEPDEENTNEKTTNGVESCQEITETTYEHILSTKVWDERQYLQVIRRSKGSFRCFKRYRPDEERGGFDDRREVGPKEKKAAYFRNLFDRWKSVDSIGEADVDRDWVKSECEVPKRCWQPPDDQVMNEDGGGNWRVLQQYRWTDVSDTRRLEVRDRKCEAGGLQ